MSKSNSKSNEYKDYSVVVHESTSEIPNLDGDWFNFYLLILLYVIQGFSIGLSSAFPIILQSKKMITYEEQAIFSIVLWPYCLKLFWAPLVDAFYIRWVGRRKSWLIPLQVFMGICLLYLADKIEEWLPEEGKPNLKMLVVIIFIINFLSATQDIVVDGWSLTMLKKKNVSYASTCNTVGVPLGIFIGTVCFTLLVSEQFWNTHFRTIPSNGGLISMKSFLYFASIVTFSITIIFGIFKKEQDTRLVNGYVELSIFQNYQLLWDVLKMHRIKTLAVALLSARIGFAAIESVSHLKLIDYGVSKDDIMIITIVTYFLKFTMPVFVSKYTTSSKPMSYYLKITPIRLLWAINYILLIYFTPRLIHGNGLKGISMYLYYFVLGAVCVINEMMNFFMTLALYAFFCRLSDPRYGGTYMTLFNTFFYLGYLASHTIVLKLVAILTFNRCSNFAENSCSTTDLQNLCKLNGGTCEIYVEGYYVVVGICMLTGFAWYFYFRNIIKNYQSLSQSHWMVNVKRSNADYPNELKDLNPK